jgi:hypothetical protein
MIYLAQDSYQSKALVNMVMNFGFNKIFESSWICTQLGAPQKELSSLKLDSPHDTLHNRWRYQRKTKMKDLFLVLVSHNAEKCAPLCSVVTPSSLV